MAYIIIFMCVYISLKMVGWYQSQHIGEMLIQCWPNAIEGDIVLSQRRTLIVMLIKCVAQWLE